MRPMRQIKGLRDRSPFSSSWIFLPVLLRSLLFWRGNVFVLQLVEHRERCVQASIHHGRIYRFCSADTAGIDIDGRMDSPARRQTLADTAPRDLRKRDRRRDSLLLAGEVGCTEAGVLWGTGRDFTRVAGMELACEEEGASRGADQSRAKFLAGAFLVNR